ncbi:unnamed protein product [Brassicogethes aeneus]|uniref:Uncharacterized protein n=1 Tax=Brassicogethes aeneus TaxID=1431903 RepID=A0A9P0B1M0_BRAAE|nr:unnamed protein product [Brassicogethes aeneus]
MLKMTNKVTVQTVTRNRTFSTLTCITITVVLITLIAGIVCRCVLDDYLSRIVLLALICFLVVFGIGILTTMLILRRRESQFKVKISKNARYSAAPTAPVSSGPPSYVK